MIDPVLHELIEHTIDSPIKLQLVLLFHENPMMELDVKQASNRIYRDIWSTGDALRELQEDGILAFVLGDHARYRYAPLPQLTERISKLVQGFNEPIERDLLQRAVRDVADDARYRRTVKTMPRGVFEFQVL